MSLDRPAADLLAAGKLWLTTPMVRGGPRTGDMPYLSTALYALVAVPSGDVATMATDPAWRLYVNPAWLADSQLTAAEVGAALAHHVWHLLADHAGRASDMGVRGSTSRAWRVAADVTIHEVAGGLAEWAGGSRDHGASLGPALPGPGSAPSTGSGRAGGRAPATGPALAARARALDDHHRLIGAAELGLPAGRAAEEYYAMLTGLPAHQDDPEHDPSWVPRAPGGAANPDPQGAAGEPCAGSPRPGPPGPRPGSADPQHRRRGPSPGDHSGADPSCGSGCDGVHRAYELPELGDAGGLNPVAAEAVRRAVAIEFQANPGRGDLPGDWGRWVSTILDPVVDWRNVLHAAVRRGLGWATGHTDYTYTRISRRQAAAGQVILPALRRHVPRVGIVVDTSGSVDDGLLAQALGEIDGVLSALGVADPQVSVLAVDAALHAVTTVRRADAVRLAGGGGTDMALGITAAQELRPPVDVILVLTDGRTGWPGHPAAVPVIAVLIGRTRADLPRTPDWIHRVECVR
ncbi:MAG: VWA-like domain-containing protein [Candidatus Nanopelagicales bacterium]|jgi:predicted metal-dependent peptidase|nr:VWA-like domain-containing protein [Candidatus Nanopelagicales bacterium]